MITAYVSGEYVPLFDESDFNSVVEEYPPETPVYSTQSVLFPTVVATEFDDDIREHIDVGGVPAYPPEQLTNCGCGLTLEDGWQTISRAYAIAHREQFAHGGCVPLALTMMRSLESATAVGLMSKWEPVHVVTRDIESGLLIDSRGVFQTAEEAFELYGADLRPELKIKEMDAVALRKAFRGGRSPKPLPLNIDYILQAWSLAPLYLERAGLKPVEVPSAEHAASTLLDLAFEQYHADQAGNPTAVDDVILGESTERPELTRLVRRGGVPSQFSLDLLSKCVP